MRLPGTRYQEHGWEHVRKLLGQCSLRALAHCAPALLEAAADTDADTDAHADALRALYVDLTAEALRSGGRRARGDASGNSYGDSVQELALGLVYELLAHGAYWSALCAAVRAEAARLGPFWDAPGGEAILRKKVNDMFAGLRDKVDADNYQAACGRPCSPNRIYAYRMLDTAYGEIARLFGAWREHAEQVAAILGRPIEAEPIEVRQMKSIGACKAAWVMGWSASLARFGAGPGPLHTRSKRFANLKEQPEKIQAMLCEIGDYEELSANRDQDWLQDAAAAGVWLDDYQRVLSESEQACSDAADQLLEAPSDAFADADDAVASTDDVAGAETEIETVIPEGQQEALPAPARDRQDMAAAASATAAAAVAAAAAFDVSLPPRFVALAQAAQQRHGWSARLLAGDSLPVRLAVYLKILGGADDSYPDAWCDPATGELPTMAQLARLDALSLPTLRKRRDAAIARLTAAAPP